MRCLVRVYCHLVPFFPVWSCYCRMCLSRGWCVGVDLMVYWLSLWGKRNKHMRCMKSRCIVVASTWCLLCGFVLTCVSLLSCRVDLVRLALCVRRGISRLIKLNFYGVCCLCVSHCSFSTVCRYSRPGFSLYCFTVWILFSNFQFGTMYVVYRRC